MTEEQLQEIRRSNEQTRERSGEDRAYVATARWALSQLEEWKRVRIATDIVADYERKRAIAESQKQWGEDYARHVEALHAIGAS